MYRQPNRKIVIMVVAACLSANVFADGMIEFNPYIGMGITYDNNIFRFETDQQANAAGYNKLNDQLKQLDVGFVSNINISNQKLNVNANFTDNTYERNSFLDNLSKSLGLNWNWIIGDKFFGVIGKTRNQASVGFTEARVIQRVIRTTDINTVSANWLILSDLAVFATKDDTKVENDQSVFTNNNRNDDIYSLGLRYTTPLGNQISASWREVESDFPDRTAANTRLFGDSSTEKTKNLSMRWILTDAIRLNGSVSNVDLSRTGNLNKNFSGSNHRFSLDYALTDRFSVGASAYKELTPIDDVAANYIKVKGRVANFSWTLTDKVSVQSSYLRETYDFLGNSGLLTNVFNANRKDDIDTLNLGLTYRPIQSTVMQLQYTNSGRDSNIFAQSYDYQSLNLNVRYNFQ